ncbi:MAG: hypothetical protein LBE89_02545 [Helicobacteraceae bacterium]|nr:hypothetical protein [Helicobacteraceae bacterium]
MKQYEFENSLNRNSLPRAVILYGDEFLTNHFAVRAQENLPENLSTLKLYYKEFEFEEAKKHLAERGLFSSGNLLIVKTDKKIEAKHLNAILDITRKKEDSFLIMIYEAEDAKAKLTPLEKRGDVAVVRLFAPKQNEAVGFLKKRAQSFNLHLKESEAHHLLKLYDNSLLLAYGEIEKLAVYGETDERLQDMICVGQSEANILRLISLIVSHAPFYKELESILLENDEPMTALLSIIQVFRRLFMFNAAMRFNLPSGDFLPYVLPPQLADIHTKLAQKISFRQFCVLFELLSEMELLFKKSETREKKALLCASLIKLQTIFL